MLNVRQIIKEAMEKNPVGLKESLEEELRGRVALALEAKMKAYTVQMSDGVKIEVNAFNDADALRTAARQTAGRAFGARAIKIVSADLDEQQLVGSSQLMESKSPKSLRDFQAILKKIDSELTRKLRKKYSGKTGGDDTPMFDNGAKDLNNGYFSYNFDGYLTTIVRFNDDNSISAWYDVFNLKSIKDKLPHQVFKTVAVMIDTMSTEMTSPDKI